MRSQACLIGAMFFGLGFCFFFYFLMEFSRVYPTSSDFAFKNTPISVEILGERNIFFLLKRQLVSFKHKEQIKVSLRWKEQLKGSFQINGSGKPRNVGDFPFLIHMYQSIYGQWCLWVRREEDLRRPGNFLGILKLESDHPRYRHVL